MNLFRLLALSLLTSMLAACGGNEVKQPPDAPKSQYSVSSITIPVEALIEQTDDKRKISSAAMKECSLPAQYTQLFREIASENNINVQISGSNEPTPTGYYLKPTFTYIISDGNPFLGHRKYTQMTMELYKDGKKVSSAQFGRNSSGGLFGGYKGSCSVLGRTVEANVSDAVAWLKNPVDGSVHGDM